MKTLLGSLLTLALYFSGLFVLWSPFPLFYLSLSEERKNWWAGLFFILLGASLFYLFILPAEIYVASLGTLSFYLLVACFLSAGVWKQWSLVVWGFNSGVGVTLILIGAAFAGQALGWIDLEGILQASVVETSRLLEDLLEKPEFFKNRQEILPFVLQMKQMLSSLPKLVPAFLFIFTVFVMFLNIALLSALTSKQNKLRWMGPFHQLHIPSGFIWVLIAAGGGFFLDDYFFKTGSLKMVALNLLLAAGFVYFIQGLSILAFFMKRFSPLFRFFVYGLVLLFLQILGLVVAGLGLMELWVDFRKMGKRVDS